MLLPVAGHACKSPKTGRLPVDWLLFAVQRQFNNKHARRRRRHHVFALKKNDWLIGCKGDRCQTAIVAGSRTLCCAPNGESCHGHAIHIGKYYEFLKPLQLSMRARVEVNCRRFAIDLIFSPFIVTKEKKTWRHVCSCTAVLCNDLSPKLLFLSFLLVTL